MTANGFPRNVFTFEFYRRPESTVRKKYKTVIARANL